MTRKPFRPWEAHGGPAFPVEDGSAGRFKGMSLRDWFAGQALPIAMTDNGIHTAKVAAEYAYEMADAMLAARKETAE